MLKPAPDAITPAGDEPVAEVAQGTRNETQGSGDGGPRLRQLPQHCERRVRTKMDLFGWAIEIADNQDRVGNGLGICGGDVVSSR